MWKLPIRRLPSLLTQVPVRGGNEVPPMRCVALDQVAVRGGIPASASVTSFAAVYGASAAGDDVGEVDGLWAPEEWSAGREGADAGRAGCIFGLFCCINTHFSRQPVARGHSTSKRGT